ncbi:uncharacterized protein [Diabrotica undecimpunctata]|uniref:uncharacterized protein n=1 Tax=Diabrotica undecimpunctata TaxID=50387 RepID=UPI003B63E0DB
MKWLVLLSLVTLSVALLPRTGRQVTVGVAGNVILVGSGGSQIDIRRSLSNPRTIDIILRSPNAPVRTLKIDEVRNGQLIGYSGLLGSNYQGANQVDILTDLFRQYEGTVDDQSYYGLLNKLQYLVEAGVINRLVLDVVKNWDLQERVQDVSDIVPLQGLSGYGNYEGQIRGYSPLREITKNGVQGKWNYKQEWLNNYSPVQPLRNILQQIQQQRELQQDLLGQYKYLPQQYLNSEYLQNQDIDTHQILNLIYKQQLGQGRVYPLNQYLVSQKQVNGQVRYNVPEQFINLELLNKVNNEQTFINQRVQQLVEQKQPVSEELFIQQYGLNKQVDQLIQSLVYHQNVISQQVEQYIEQGQVLPQDLLSQQTLVYQQVRQLIKLLSTQQLNIVNQIQLLVEQGNLVGQEWYSVQKNIYQQIQRLIQQVVLQQSQIKVQIQVLIQQRQIVPQELILFQQLAYQQVEQFIQVLIKQFIYQQANLRQLVQVFVQQGRVVPQQLVSSYFLIYKELVQLIQQGDLVPQELISQQQLIHQQVVLLLQRGVLPQQSLNQLVSQEQQLNLRQPQIYQRVPRVY